MQPLPAVAVVDGRLLLRRMSPEPIGRKLEKGRVKNMGKALKVASLALAIALGCAFPGAMVAVAAGGMTTSVTEVVCPPNPVTANTGILNVGQGMMATATFTLAAGCPSITLVSYTAPSATFTFASADQQVLFASQTASGAGAHTLSVNLPDCFFQVDLVFGSAIAHLGPADSNNFYSAQGRLIQGINGGTTACTETVTPPATETPPVVVVTPPVVVVTPPVVVVTVPTVTVTPPPSPTPGPITWAPGFGPNGVVASVQAPPVTTTTTTTPAGTSGTGVVLGAQHLPSTSTDSSDNSGIAIFGLGLCVVGLMLLGRGAPSRSEAKA
jgi:hypothetical protein